MKKIGILGLGHMGMAIAKGAVKAMDPNDLAAYDSSSKKCEEASSLGITIASSPADLSASAHILLIAVRPQDIDTALSELSSCPPQCILTIVAGIPIARFIRAFGELPAMRAMPNTPLQLSEGAAALCRNELCSDEDFELAMNLFSSMGVAREIPESQMCNIITVNGSTPAYFYYLVECLLNDAVARGLEESTARELLVQTMIGSGKLLQASPDKPLSSFVDEVCSKGGTTIEAISLLKAKGFEQLIQEADTACINRAEELGNEHK
ncbi:MAG: pyrroline-5-carboxylate reductase [Solobacterium sp.]|nr:pyrroline-5-carboxylate reductase [Solobacterium sp.]